tara:strand:+ start:8118 stop:8732 length:615 start_codon:yes stop_codon:yes gene_type:complete
MQNELQPAPEANAPDNPGAEAQGEPDLEALLNEGSEALKEEQVATPEPVTPSPSGMTDDERAALNFVAQAEAKRQVSTELGELVTTLQADESVPAMSDANMSRMIRGYAAENPLFDKAFNSRQTNPNAWKVAKEQCRKQLAADLGGEPDQQVTSDLEAARAAVRTNSSAAPEPDFNPAALSGMNSADIAALAKKQAKENAAKRR